MLQQFTLMLLNFDSAVWQCRNISPDFTLPSHPCRGWYKHLKCWLTNDGRERISVKERREKTLSCTQHWGGGVLLWYEILHSSLWNGFFFFLLFQPPRESKHEGFYSAVQQVLRNAADKALSSMLYTHSHIKKGHFYVELQFMVTGN